MDPISSYLFSTYKDNVKFKKMKFNDEDSSDESKLNYEQIHQFAMRESDYKFNY